MSPHSDPEPTLKLGESLPKTSKLSQNRCDGRGRLGRKLTLTSLPYVYKL